MSPEFGKHFWKFIISAGYQHKNISTGKNQFYRFSKPNDGYPCMIELFSRRLEIIPLPDSAVLTPLPIGKDISSLSAIMLDDTYYNLLKSGRRTVEGITILDAAYLILFKAKAWIDLTHRKNKGEQIDSRNIKKHKNDVYRLSILLHSDSSVLINTTIYHDISSFIQKMRSEETDLKQLGILKRSNDEILDSIKRTFILKIEEHL